ncbi:hypothetical protein PR202_ga03248 [Eleusine coracana subsp. coracana]|uniref:NAD-dependent epimerase/dehydratase domain-containing protein n=1 Tax=Eleusine coracana subsp. coracana TaxID=191504 RepID=A0AAV5BNS9_ELECO|nr:hypothetical protein PR202_ga03248 [Eleusine coracana subsp. coracana]
MSTICNKQQAANNNGEQEKPQVVCVTGAGGFIGSWVVRELLRRGYRVRGTARDPVAVEGTRNVINAAADEGARRVVFTSSYGAVHMDPNRSPDAVLDETCWSDYEFCKKTDNLYCCAKMMAEITATEESAKRGLQLSVVLPCMTMGPMLQQTLNFSSIHVARYLMGTKKTYPNAVAAYVDVRDVARAHVLAYERPEARGRYLCIGTVLHRAQLIGLLKELFPQYPVTAECEDDGMPMANPYKFSSQRIKDLGLQFTPLNKSLYEAVISMQQNGHLPVIPFPPQQQLHTCNNKSRYKAQRILLILPVTRMENILDSPGTI